MIPPKTARDLVPSLRGSAFRRSACDARTAFVRRLKTLGTLPARRPCRRAGG